MLTSILALIHDWNEQSREKWLSQQASLNYEEVKRTAFALRDELFAIFSQASYSPALAAIRTPFDVRPISHKKVQNGDVYSFELLKTTHDVILPYVLVEIGSRINQDISIESAPIIQNPYLFPYSLLLRQPQIVQIENNLDSITISVLLR